MKIIGIAIGGTKTAVTYANINNNDVEIICKNTFKTDVKDAENETNLLFAEVDKFNDFEFISIICGGPLDTKKGIICSPPHLKNYVDYNIVKEFKEKYNVPVTLLNDADACALAEYKFGGHENSKNMAYLTFGTGLGSGLILNGQLFTGNNGMAGEIGHVRLERTGLEGYGKIGSVESFCSGGKIAEIANIKRVGRETMLNDYEAASTSKVSACARLGDKLSIEIFDDVAKYLGEAVSILIDILNLDTVVIGGIYPRCKDLLEEKVIKSAKENTIPFNFDAVKIVPSTLGEEIDEYSSLSGYFINK